MGITTCGRNKRSKSGAMYVKTEKKRKNTMGRQPSNTKIGEARHREVRVRGGNIKNRALRLNNGSFTFLSTNFTTDTAIERVVYHPSCNELMRTNTLTKGSVVRIAVAPFSEELKKDTRCSADQPLMDMASKGFLYGILTSRPGQTGVASGYVLQGEELEFFQSKTKQSKKLVK